MNAVTPGSVAGAKVTSPIECQRSLSTLILEITESWPREPAGALPDELSPRPLGLDTI
jgi:hypothetical protein